jgi:hypothetical protein
MAKSPVPLSQFYTVHGRAHHFVLHGHTHAPKNAKIASRRDPRQTGPLPNPIDNLLSIRSGRNFPKGLDCPAGATFSGRGPGESVVSWTLKVQFLFAFFFGAREDQPVLLRSRATCRLSRIISEILQDRHRPPRDLADGLMRNSSSLGGDFKGRQPLAWQT